MNKERTTDIEYVQVNLGKELRTACRDYHEYFMTGSIKLVLATWSRAKLDEIALDNPTMFRYRFKFEASRIARQQVLAIQDKNDLTDGEICWMRRSGQLTIKRDEAKLTPTRMMPVMGWLQLGALSLVFGSGMIQIAYSSVFEWRQMMWQMVLAGVWGGVALLMFRLYIAPWRVLKRKALV